jgi:nitrite reductase/ring-hydroxylating ferredoxin subunit
MVGVLMSVAVEDEAYRGVIDAHDGRVMVRLGRVADLARRKRTLVVVDGVELLVLCVRRRFTVVENRCPHLGSSLANGKIVGRTLTCAAHGYKYALEDGALIPGWRSSARHSLRLAVLATEVKAGSLLVNIGDVLSRHGDLAQAASDDAHEKPRR